MGGNSIYVVDVLHTYHDLQHAKRSISLVSGTNLETTSITTALTDNGGLYVDMDGKIMLPGGETMVIRQAHLGYLNKRLKLNLFVTDRKQSVLKECLAAAVTPTPDSDLHSSCRPQI